MILYSNTNGSVKICPLHFEKWGRTENTCEYSDHYRLRVGWSSGSIGIIIPICNDCMRNFNHIINFFVYD